MKAPILNRKLVLEDAYRVPDDAGGYSLDWQALGTLWAAISAGSGRDQARHELHLSRVPLKIVVRAAPHGAPSRPQAGQRFREGTRIYAVNAVAEYGKDARYIVCHADEEVAA